MSEPFAVQVLMPVFFALTGMRTDLWDAIHSSHLPVFLAILVIAFLGKWGGTMLGGVATGMAWREACELGILVNTRGLVELVVLNVGRDLQIIPKELFSIMVCMAIVTTLATTPLTVCVEHFWPLPAETGQAVHLPKRAGLPRLLHVSGRAHACTLPDIPLPITDPAVSYLCFRKLPVSVMHRTHWRGIYVCQGKNMTPLR
jgi:Kef-type K+ transport system membrane component KefB